jgi:hypothetical protein
MMIKMLLTVGTFKIWESRISGKQGLKQTYPLIRNKLWEKNARYAQILLVLVKESRNVVIYFVQNVFLNG